MKRLGSFFIIVALFYLTLIIYAYANSDLKIVDRTDASSYSHCAFWIKYPEIQYQKNKDIENKINKQISAYLDGRVEAFRERYMEAHPLQAWKMDYYYNAQIANDRWITIKMRGVMDECNGPFSMECRTFLIDIEDGQNLDLNTIFTAGSPYLVKISEYCRNYIKTLSFYKDPVHIEKGTAPDDVNFRNFYLENDGLLIMLPSSQVSSFSTAIIEVHIPWSYLKPYLKNNIIIKFN
jgi:hypothetical protein